MGMEAGNSAALSQAPIADTGCPVSIENRDGAHKGEGQYAVSNLAPRSTRVSIAGVRTRGCS